MRWIRFNEKKSCILVLKVFNLNLKPKSITLIKKWFEFDDRCGKIKIKKRCVNKKRGSKCYTLHIQINNVIIFNSA